MSGQKSMLSSHECDFLVLVPRDKCFSSAGKTVIRILKEVWWGILKGGAERSQFCFN